YQNDGSFILHTSAVDQHTDVALALALHFDSISGQTVGHAHSALNSSGFRGSNMWLDLESQTPNVAVDTLNSIFSFYISSSGQYSSINSFLKSSQGWAIAAAHPRV
ncbi:hypothetical protein Tco_0125715, partial [Tanacetum coccineum]